MSDVIIPVIVPDAVVAAVSPISVSVGDIIVKVDNAPINLDNETISKILEIIALISHNQQMILGRVANLEISVSELKVKEITTNE